jgi:hypothetical protein
VSRVVEGRRFVVWQDAAGEQLEWVRIDNDPVALGLEIAKATRIRRWCWRPPPAGTGQ